MDSHRYRLWRELTLQVRARGADREEMVTIRRMEAGFICESPLKPFIAVTMRAAVCWQKKVAPLEDCPP